MAKKKEKKAGKRMKKKELVKVLLEFFHTKQDEVLSLKYIFEQLHLTTHPLKMLCMDILSELSMDDYITEVDKHKYKLNNHGVEMTGTFQRKSNGKNSFIPEGGGEPIFVAERNSAHAMNNDKVRIAFYAKRRGREAEGEVIEILERANDTFVGTLEVAKSYAFLVTENRTLANDIFIPKEKLKGGKTGDKAIVKVVEWPDKAKNPIGQVIDILGRAGDNTTEMHAILAEFGLPGTSHIVNGHVPVQEKKGESPIKGGGRLVVIDGGFCRAYHEKTGIAGYTLVYSSRTMSLRTHQPFESAEKAVNENLDILSQKNILETENHRILVEETDEGEILREKVHDLKQLVRAYQLGWIKETRCDDSVW